MDWSPTKRVNGFCQKLAHLMAHAAEDAYCKDGLEAVKLKWDCPVDLIDHRGTQAIVIHGPSLIIAFRGTEPDDIKDWLADLNVKKTRVSFAEEVTKPLSRILPKVQFDSGCYIHEGFLKAYRLVAAEVIKICKANQDKDIFLTGHSLGGALANVAMWDLETHRSVRIKRSYTFGSPRVFGRRASRKVRNALNGRQFRVVNRNDIVPRVPSLLRFQHTGAVAYINRRNEIQINPSFFYIAIDRILGYRANIIRSHFMEYYSQGTASNAK